MIEPRRGDGMRRLPPVAGADRRARLGRYQLVTTLGQGGMGTIHLAVSTGLGEARKPLVLKELQRGLVQDPNFLQMFLGEVELASRLCHPNIVETLEAAEDDGRYFLVMEFLRGQPFSEVLRVASFDGRLTLGMRIHALCEALAGLHYAHELRDYDGTPMNVVHRDVSPQNVFLTYGGETKVVDFGIAKVNDAGAATTPGVFKGRFSYAAPEQVLGRPVDRRADIFAVGVMLWETVALQRFAPGPPTEVMVDARLSGIEPALAEVMPNVDPRLAAICAQAMQVDRERRFANAVEFRNELLGYLAGAGEGVDSERLGGTLREVFSDHYDAIRQLIAAHTSDNTSSSSTVRPVVPVPPAAGVSVPPAARSEARTEVADMRALMASSRANEPWANGPWLNPAPRALERSLWRRPTPTAVLASGLAVLSSIGIYIGLQSGDERGELEAGPGAGRHSGAWSATPEPIRAGQEALSAQPAPAGRPDAEDGPPASPAVPAGGPGGVERAPRLPRPPAEVRASGPGVQPASAAPAPTGRKSAPRPARSAPADRAAMRAPRVHDERGPGEPARAVNGPGTTRRAKGQAARGRRSNAAAGDDLKTWRKGVRRALDLEDPFGER